MILFREDRAKTVWMRHDSLRLWVLFGSFLRLLFLLNGFGKWAEELVDEFWKGEIVGSGWKINLEGNWGKEMGKPCWVSDWVGNDFHSYPAFVIEACGPQFLPFPESAGKVHYLSPLGEV